MWRARFFGILPRLLADYPSARFIFLTLTVRNCPLSELRDTLAWMNKSWKRFIGRKQFPAIGFVKSVEVTRNRKDDSAHPHFHCLLMVESSYFVGRRYLSQAKWQELWKEALRADYTPIVNVKAIKPKKVEGDSQEALMIAVCETLKYSVKEDDLVHDKDWLVELTSQLHKTRAIAVGGLMKEYLSENEPEDLIHTDGESEEELADSLKLIFDWSAYIRRYIKQ
jgi:plasmid rolling circle replication initiator protein Rep